MSGAIGRSAGSAAVAVAEPVADAVAEPVPEPVPELFSTVGLPDARRVELWERHNTAALVRLDVRANGRPLQAQIGRAHV